MSAVQILDADERDVERLIEIYSSPDLYHSREEAGWFVKSFFDYHHVKVAKLDSKIIGVVFWRGREEKHHGLTEVEDLWVDENYRRRGFGTKLLTSALEDMKQFFIESSFVLRKVLVTTGEDNEPAKRLYEKIGFQRSAVLEGLFARDENELVYILTMNP
jgi:ribosomal protein S18 acetylase RimI-like enzyme